MTACTLMVTDHGSLGTEVKMGGNTLYFIRSAATGVMGAEAGLGQDTAALFPVQPSKTKRACIHPRLRHCCHGGRASEEATDGRRILGR